MEEEEGGIERLLWSREATNSAGLWQCAVCEYHRRPCRLDCLYRLYFSANFADRQAYARIVLAYGEDQLEYVISRSSSVDLATQTLINSARVKFLNIFDHPYDLIVMNLYTPIIGFRRYVAKIIVPRAEEEKREIQDFYGAPNVNLPVLHRRLIFSFVRVYKLILALTLVPILRSTFRALLRR